MVSDDFKNLMALGGGELSDKEKSEHLIRCMELLSEACQIAPGDHPMGQIIILSLGGLADILQAYVKHVKEEMAKRNKDQGE
jgi:hypothetical protein